jgi:hypothetical protein
MCKVASSYRLTAFACRKGNSATVLEPPPRDLKTHAILDIQPVSLGSVVRPLTADDDLLDKMLEGPT